MRNNNLQVQEKPEEKKKGFKFNVKISKIDWKNFLIKFIKLLGKFFAGAIILSFLGHLAPDLRVQLPSFYKVIDMILYGLEWFFSQFPL